jgi:hypothetical protein
MSQKSPLPLSLSQTGETNLAISPGSQRTFASNPKYDIYCKFINREEIEE